MEKFDCNSYHSIEDFIKIIEILRGDGGCPWDAAQTHESIRNNCLEEAYEVCEAIDEDNPIHLKEELGDLLMQVVFHARIEEEKGNYTFFDICNDACNKLIFRHPHVFGDNGISQSSESADIWEKNKRIEHGQKTTADAIDGVAKTLPGLWRAQKILHKAINSGFDNCSFEKSADDFIKYTKGNDKSKTESAFQNLLLSSVILAEKNGIDAEKAVQDACDKFAVEYRKREEVE